MTPDASFDGGTLDCGSGLLLLIRRHIDPLAPGQLLEVRSAEASVEDDLPAWARLTGNELVSRTRTGDVRCYLIRKAGTARLPLAAVPVATTATRAPAAPAEIKPLSVMGVGSWPRPAWLLRRCTNGCLGVCPRTSSSGTRTTPCGSRSRPRSAPARTW